MHDARDAEDKRLLEAGELGRLVEGYSGLILRRCRARIWTEAAAMAVAGDIVVRLFSELERGRRYPVPYRVVVNQVISWKIKEHFAVRPVAAELADEAAEDRALVAAEARLDLRALAEGLTPREREVVLSRVGARLEADQLAAALGTTRRKVNRAWFRGKRKLRERLVAA